MNTIGNPTKFNYNKNRFDHLTYLHFRNKFKTSLSHFKINICLHKGRHLIPKLILLREITKPRRYRMIKSIFSLSK